MDSEKSTFILLASSVAAGVNVDAVRELSQSPTKTSRNQDVNSRKCKLGTDSTDDPFCQHQHII